MLASIKEKINNIEIDASEKNNLKMSTDKLIRIYDRYFEADCIELIENDRSIYEISTKAVSLTEKADLKESYEKIDKPVKEQKDNPRDVRFFIKENFNKFFSVIEENLEFEKIAGKHILDCLYEELSDFIHTTKVKEFVYVLLQNEKYEEFTTISTLMEFAESVMIIHLDLINTKYQIIEEEIEIFSKVFVFRLFVFLLYLIDNKEIAAEIMLEARNFFEDNTNNLNIANIRKAASLYEIENLKNLIIEEVINKGIMKDLILEIGKVFTSEERKIIMVHLEKYIQLLISLNEKNKKE